MMKITLDGSIDHFFRQWVYGTDASRWRLTWRSPMPAAGSTHQRMVTQSQVPDGFATIVPLYLTFDKGAFMRFGAMV